MIDHDLQKQTKSKTDGPSTNPPARPATDCQVEPNELLVLVAAKVDREDMFRIGLSAQTRDADQYRAAADLIFLRRSSAREMVQMLGSFMNSIVFDNHERHLDPKVICMASFSSFVVMVLVRGHVCDA